MKAHALLLVVAAIAVLTEPAQAQVVDCSVIIMQSAVALQSSVIAQGTHSVTAVPGCAVARSATQVLQWTAFASAPVVLAGVSPTITWTATGFSGCTVGTISSSSWSTSAGSGSSADATVTMTSSECHGYIFYRYKLIVSSVTVYDFPAKLPVNIRVEQAYPTAFTNTLSGTLDNLDRLCAASATGTSCTTPTVTLAGAVTVHNDGTLTVTNAGGQTMTLAGAATIHADGSLTVTNAGGQAISFTGPLVVHQDPICSTVALAADPKACTLNTTPGNVTVGNNTNTVVIPDHQTTTLCGPGSMAPFNATSCKPLQGMASVVLPGGADAPNLPWLGMLLFLSVLVALFWWQGMAYALGWSVAAFIANLLPTLPFSLPIALICIVVGVVVQYLNERRGERSQAPEDLDTQGVV